MTSSQSATNHDVLISESFTHVNATKFQHTWKIKNFTLSQEICHKFESSSFSIGHKHMVGRLQLDVNHGLMNYYAAVYFHLVSCPLTNANAKVKISILNDQREEVCDKSMFISEKSFKTGGKFGFDQYLPMRILLEQKADLIPNDDLTIVLEVIYGGDEIEHGVEQSREARRSKKFPNHYCITDDFECLLKDGKFSDVTFLVGSEEFKAHKNILSARSPVFAAMFAHDMKESKDNRVRVDDIAPEVFRELLRFIYTDESKEIESMAAGLLAAAEKYGIDGLKQKCCRALFFELTVENATRTLLLAELYNEAMLKRGTILYMKGYAEEIAEQQDFKNLMASHPHLVVEMFRSKGMWHERDEKKQEADVSTEKPAKRRRIFKIPRPRQ